ncbi:leukocyte receptor cluster member 1 homolog [Helicoverpa zea]|uniref:leukocyte receptor cluster member 1 homolog n=1 Tax=Helicoverpa zea TaxID=7113 RepID=UPI001F57AB7F|nr:leukocyte receptor cluster member 1 homolog [Helicoverpa zea]XP_047026828.1 leukocyte receptor cluster member 1 homolog [Helicoverpa zea]
MNILPKKRWHVRTKENIARVRKDEAEAAEKEKQEKLRVERADREARLQVLKQKSRQKLQEFGIDDEPKSKKEETTEHINLFTNLEDAIKTTNKDHDNDVKEKKEEYEKKIGYLTYLGQDTNEALGKKNWYEVPPETARGSRSTDIKDTYDKLVLKDADGKPKIKESDEKNGEIGWKKKQMLDPMNAFKHLHDYSYKDKKKTVTKDVTEKRSKHKKKEKKHKKEDKDAKLQKLREARLKREQQERHRTELFLKGLHNPSKPETVQDTGIKPKYNSQFNPELARQNYR